MKQFLGLLAGSTLVFMTLSIIEEWEVFRPLFIPGTQAVVEESPEEINQTIDRFNMLLIHFYRYGGDRRFLQRLPASTKIQNELDEDAEYLKMSRIVQDMDLVRTSPVSHRTIGNDIYEQVREEEWSLIYRNINGDPLSDRKRFFVVTLRYVVCKTVDGWTILSMEPSDES